MTEGEIPRQRTGEERYDNERVIHRIGELALEPKPGGDDSELKKELDEEYGPGGWATRTVLPEGIEELLIHNSGYYILEVYIKDENAT